MLQSKPTPHESKLTPHESKLNPHGSELTPHELKLTPYETKPTPYGSKLMLQTNLKLHESKLMPYESLYEFFFFLIIVVMYRLKPSSNFPNGKLPWSVWYCLPIRMRDLSALTHFLLFDIVGPFICMTFLPSPFSYSFCPIILPRFLSTLRSRCRFGSKPSFPSFASPLSLPRWSPVLIKSTRAPDFHSCLALSAEQAISHCDISPMKSFKLIK